MQRCTLNCTLYLGVKLQSSNTKATFGPATTHGVEPFFHYYSITRINFTAGIQDCKSVQNKTGEWGEVINTKQNADLALRAT